MLHEHHHADDHGDGCEQYEGDDRRYDEIATRERAWRILEQPGTDSVKPGAHEVSAGTGRKGGGGLLAEEAQEFTPAWGTYGGRVAIAKCWGANDAYPQS